MQKKSNVKKPDRIILLEIGVIVALLFVNFSLNLKYGVTELTGSTEIEIVDPWVIESHREPLQEEPKQQPKRKERIQEAIIFDPTSLIKQVDDLFETKEEILKPQLPAGLKFIKPLVIKPAIDSSNIIDEFPAIRPEFPGGEMALRKYIVKNFDIPDIILETQDEVKMVVEFVIDKEGYVSDFKVLSNSFPNYESEREAKKLYLGMPKWKPGQNKFGIVKTRLRQPIKIELH